MLLNNKKITALITVLILLISLIAPSYVAKAYGSMESVKNSNLKVVDVLSFNDLHGNVLESGKNIGAAKLAGVIKEYKSKTDDRYGVIPVSGGDLYQGTAISNLKQGAPVNDMLKEIRLEASAVGNHEFDWGRENLNKWSEQGGFPFLAANMVYKDSGKVIESVEPFKIIERNGVKIAFIGIATPETLTSTKASNVDGVEFLDPVETINKYVPIVKASGANAVIALTHCGASQDKTTGEITGEAAEIAKKSVGLDAVISAHSHTFVYGKLNGVSIVQAGYNGRGLSRLTFSFDDTNKLLGVEPYTQVFQGTEATLPVDETVKNLMKKHEEELKPIFSQKVSFLQERLSHDDRNSALTPLGVTVCDAMRKITNTQIAINNGGGIRRSLEKGNITVGDMYEILPFDNTIVTLDIKGSDLLKVIEHGIAPKGIGWGQFAGIKVWYDKDTNKVTSIRLADGSKIDMDKYYSVAINDFMITGGDGYDFSKAENVVNTNIVMRESIEDYWKKEGVTTLDYNLLVAGIDTNKDNPVVNDNGGDTELLTSDTIGNLNNTSESIAKTGDTKEIEILILLSLMVTAVGAILVYRNKKVI